MEINKKELYLGKATIIKNIEFKDTKYYTESFISECEKLTKDIKYNVKLADQTSISNNNQDLIYNRILIESKLNKKSELTETLFMTYAIDVRKPVAKFYKGYLDEDNNLIVFNSMMFTEEAIEEDKPLIFNSSNILECTDNTNNIINKLQSIKFENKKEVFEKLLGKWISKSVLLEHSSKFGKVKISPNVAIDVFKTLFIDRSSKYFIKEEAEYITMYDVYLTFAHIIKITDKDMINRFEKTMLINQILEINE